MESELSMTSESTDINDTEDSDNPENRDNTEVRDELDSVSLSALKDELVFESSSSSQHRRS